MYSFRQGANEECVDSVFLSVLLHFPQSGDLVGPGCVVGALVDVILRLCVFFANIAKGIRVFFGAYLMKSHHCG